MNPKKTADEKTLADAEQQILDTALQESDQLLARSLHDEERRRKRMIWLLTFAAVAAVMLVIAVGVNPDRPTSDPPASVQPQNRVADRDRDIPEQKIPANVAVRIDSSACNSIEWQEAIARQRNVPAMSSGHAQMTLLRVILPGASPDALLQVAGIKVVELGQGAGGAFRQIHNGDFIVVEHTKSARRISGSDPIEIGGFSCQRAKLYVAAPLPGKLGILGDAILTPCKPEEMGRLVVTVDVEVDDPLEIRDCIIGPIAVGGPYGKSFPFTSGRTCNTGPIAPGEYKILLPDFDKVKSRWTVKVLPGEETRVRLTAISQKEVVRIGAATSPGLLEVIASNRR